MRHLLAAALSVLLCACSMTPPEIAVSPVRKTLKEAIELGYSAGVDTVNVEVAVAYGKHGGISIPVALPISFGFSSSGSTKMKFTISTKPDNGKKRLETVNILLDSLDKNIDGEPVGYRIDAIYIYNPTTSELTEVK